MSYYLENNIQALKKFCKNDDGSYSKASDILERDAGQINYLRLLGFRCASCGREITLPTLKFFNYEARCYCWACQEKIKNY